MQRKGLNEKNKVDLLSTESYCAGIPIPPDTPNDFKKIGEDVLLETASKKIEKPVAERAHEITQQMGKSEKGKRVAGRRASSQERLAKEEKIRPAQSYSH